MIHRLVDDMKYYEEGARWYDLFSTGTPGDLSFYLKEAKTTKGRVLEVACGTGRIYLELLKAGVKIYGFDISTHMLTVLKENAKKCGLTPKIKKADMRTFRYPFKFDLIIVPYRAFLHMETREDQKKCLMSIHRNLKKGGRLILNFFDPRLDIVSKVDYRFKTVRKYINSKMFSCNPTSHYDISNQHIETKYKLSHARTDLPKEITDTLCYIFPREFMNLLELCGFRKWKLYGGFKYEPYRKNGEELVWIAHR